MLNNLNSNSKQMIIRPLATWTRRRGDVGDNLAMMMMMMMMMMMIIFKFNVCLLFFIIYDALSFHHFLAGSLLHLLAYRRQSGASILLKQDILTRT
jgi:hypothetical protein